MLVRLYFYKTLKYVHENTKRSLQLSDSNGQIVPHTKLDGKKYTFCS